MLELIISFILSLNDTLSLSLVKSYYLKKYSVYIGLLLPMFMYSLQIPLFYYGLQNTSMTILNITWNLISNILVTLVGIFYFHEEINGLKTAALWLAITSLILFALDSYIIQS